MSVSNSDFSKDAKNPSTGEFSTGSEQQYFNLIVLEFWFKALFYSYGMIFSPQILLWRFLDFPEDNSAHSRPPYLLKLGSMQQLLYMYNYWQQNHTAQ